MKVLRAEYVPFTTIENKQNYSTKETRQIMLRVLITSKLCSTLSQFNDSAKYHLHTKRNFKKGGFDSVMRSFGKQQKKSQTSEQESVQCV